MQHIAYLIIRDFMHVFGKVGDPHKQSERAREREREKERERKDWSERKHVKERIKYTGQ